MIEGLHLKKREFQERFLHVRRRTEELVLPLHPDDFMVSATPDTSPPKWHLAHTTWFFEKFLLKKFFPNYRAYDDHFDFIFNSYYKRLGSFLPKEKRGILSRPTSDDVFAYRSHVTKAVLDLLESTTEDESSELFRILEIGTHHEEQHQELILMDIKRNFYENPLRPVYQAEKDPPLHIRSHPRWINIPGGLVSIGVPKNSTRFAYDNEKDQHQAYIESFMLSSHLVTNDEFLEFIEAGGYENPLLWLSDGWDWKTKEHWEAPLYWEKEGQAWWQMTLHGMRPLSLSAPVVHISFYEAAAYAKWRGCRLPSELEWETAAQRESSRFNFLEDQHFEPWPAHEEHELFSQIHGAVWEWTSSSYMAYPRYEPLGQGLSEYNEKFMCNQFVLRGGSCVTPEDHYRTTYRNFYYPHMRWQYAGLRLAKDLE